MVICGGTQFQPVAKFIEQEYHTLLTIISHRPNCADILSIGGDRSVAESIVRTILHGLHHHSDEPSENPGETDREERADEGSASVDRRPNAFAGFPEPNGLKRERRERRKRTAGSGTQ